MTWNKIITLAICMASIGLLSACTEANYAAHVVKQIPFPGDNEESSGSFKVGNQYAIKGRAYYPEERYRHVETGTASWYGPGFDGKKTANGEYFDKNELTAAHRTLQMPSIIRVTNLGNGRSVLLRVNDRGPFAHDRILDVSERAATLLGFKNVGTAKIKLEVMEEASREVAARAKAGYDTRGYEVALNQSSQYVPVVPASAKRPPAEAVMPRPEPITQMAMSAPQSPAPVPVGTISPYQIAANNQIVPGTKPQPYGVAPITPQVSPQVRPQPHPQNITHPPVSYANPAPVEARPLTTASYQSARSSNPSYVTGSNISNLGTGNIYIQAGSFSQEQNALSLSHQLASYGPSKVYMTSVNNTPYFRVRLGPYNDREQAREILTALNQNGNKNAVIIVD